MEPADQYPNERLDHLGIVAGVCQEMGLAAWLNASREELRKRPCRLRFGLRLQARSSMVIPQVQLGAIIRGGVR